MSDTIHGYPVVMSAVTPASPGKRAGRVVLVDREVDVPRYVTGWQGDGDIEWTTGHYIHDREAAVEDFTERAKRGF